MAAPARALIERDRDPAGYKRLCTHYIQASATPTLERLGLARAIEEAGGVRNDAEVFTRWGWIVAPSTQTIRRPAYGYNIRRSTLDPMLRKTAAQTAGVEFLPGFSARELLIKQGRIFGLSAQGEGDAKLDIEAKLLVGADGRNSRVAELAGLPAKETANGRIFYFAHYRNLPLASGTRSQLWFLEPDVAYTFPNDDGVTLVAAMPARAKAVEWKADPEAAMTRLFERLPRAPSLPQAQRVTPFMGMIDYPNLQRSVSKPGLALIGDAALSIDPLWGIGCGWALQSAEWLAGAVGRTWTSPTSLDRGLSVYAKRHRSELAGHQFLIEDFSTGRPFNFLERLTFSAAARDVRRYFLSIRKSLYWRPPISPPRRVGSRDMGKRSLRAQRCKDATELATMIAAPMMRAANAVAITAIAKPGQQGRAVRMVDTMVIRVPLLTTYATVKHVDVSLPLVACLLLDGEK